MIENFEEAYEAKMPANVEISAETAEECSTRGQGGNVLRQGDVIELPDTESPKIYTKSFDSANPDQKGKFIVTKRNGHLFEFFFTQLGKRVREYDPKDNTAKLVNGKSITQESNSTVSKAYRDVDRLSDFMKVYKGKKIRVGNHKEVYTVFGANTPNPRPRTSWVYDFELTGNTEKVEEVEKAPKAK